MSKTVICYDSIFDCLPNFASTENISALSGIEDKSTIEQMQLLQQLDEEDKTTVFKITDKMLTTKKFKDFFTKNAATL